jgi:rhodanese-related sulfurtransferase
VVAVADQAVQEVAESNKTTLGLYVWPQGAYAMWQADPDHVHLLDVRTFEEYVFGGHVEFAKNVPLVFPRFNPEGPAMPGRPPGCSGELNPDFVPAVQQVCPPTDTVLVMCTTGGRGAMAVNLLAQAGFTTVYNIVTGFEGDRVDDPGSVFHGKHMRNGWKNAGLPWGYDFHPDLMWEEPQ